MITETKRNSELSKKENGSDRFEGKQRMNKKLGLTVAFYLGRSGGSK